MIISVTNSDILFVLLFNSKASMYEFVFPHKSLNIQIQIRYDLAKGDNNE